MKKELEEKLMNDFPKLFRGTHEPITQNLMPFGCECGDGWFGLIYDLSKKIDDEAKRLELSDEYYPKLTQVKEKFGTLRYYILGATDKMLDWIEEAEIKSGGICESCGEGGTVHNDLGWVSTLCEKCYRKSKLYTLIRNRIYRKLEEYWKAGFEAEDVKEVVKSGIYKETKELTDEIIELTDADTDELREWKQI